MICPISIFPLPTTISNTVNIMFFTMLLVTVYTSINNCLSNFNTLNAPKANAFTEFKCLIDMHDIKTWDSISSMNLRSFYSTLYSR